MASSLDSENLYGLEVIRKKEYTFLHIPTNFSWKQLQRRELLDFLNQPGSKLVYTPGIVESREHFFQYYPLYSMALDGFVSQMHFFQSKASGGPRLIVYCPESAEARLIYKTSCEQMYFRCREKFFAENFQRHGQPYINVFFNKIDEVVAVNLWLLLRQNSIYMQGRALSTLVFVTNMNLVNKRLIAADKAVNNQEDQRAIFAPCCQVKDNQTLSARAICRLVFEPIWTNLDTYLKKQENFGNNEEQNITQIEMAIDAPKQQSLEELTLFKDYYASDKSQGISFVPGKKVGAYDILEQIGAGGMAKVYKARHEQLDRIVAIKVMKSSGKGQGHQRFLSEAKLSARLKHPNIVSVHDSGSIDDIDYIVMDFIPGKTLQNFITQSKTGLDRSLQIMKQVMAAVEYAHDNGIIHRDLKPSNIIIEQHSKRPLVMDFGLAKEIKHGKDMTKTGEIIGTPKYMAPEQASGQKRKISPKTDVYSLGAIFYQLLTGIAPFQGRSTMAILYSVLHTEAIPLRKINPKIPVELETMCMKALEKQPEKRYQSVKEFKHDLELFLNGEPITARPVGVLVRGWKKIRKHKLVASLLVTIIALLAISIIWYNEISKTVILAPADQYKRKAQKLFNEGRFSEAEKYLSKAIKLNPQDFDAYLNRANIYRSIRNFKQGIADIEKAIAIRPHNTLPYKAGADIYRLSNNLPDCERYLTKALTLAPQDFQSYRNRGIVRLTRGNCNGAQQDFDRAIAIAPDKAQNYKERANFYSTQRKLDRAEKDYSKAIELEANDADAYIGRSYVRRHLGNFLGALQDINKFIEISSNKLVGYKSRLELYLAYRKSAEAKLDLLKILELDPNDVKAYMAKAQLEYMDKNFSLAEQNLKKALELKPDSFEIYCMLGDLHCALQYYKKALDDYQKALALNPNLPGLRAKMKQISNMIK